MLLIKINPKMTHFAEHIFVLGADLHHFGMIELPALFYRFINLAKENRQAA